MSMPQSQPRPSSQMIAIPPIPMAAPISMPPMGPAVPVAYMRPPVPEPRVTTPRSMAMTMLPQQPLPDEMVAVQQHLLQRPLNEDDMQKHVEFMQGLDVTFGDYAPGGENMPGDDAGKVHMI